VIFFSVFLTWRPSIDDEGLIEMDVRISQLRISPTPIVLELPFVFLFFSFSSSFS
jgi:hypothetical protein